jgi:hypothetical protein
VLQSAKSKSKDLPLGVVITVLGGAICLIGTGWFLLLPKEGGTTISAGSSPDNPLASASGGITQTPIRAVSGSESPYRAYFEDLNAANLPKLAVAPVVVPVVPNSDTVPRQVATISSLPSVPGLPRLTLPPLPAPPINQNVLPAIQRLPRSATAVTITPPAPAAPRISLIGGTESSVTVEIDGQPTELITGIDGPRGIRLIEAKFQKDRYLARLRLPDGSLSLFSLALPPEAPSILSKPGQSVSSKPTQVPIEVATPEQADSQIIFKAPKSPENSQQAAISDLVNP